MHDKALSEIFEFSFRTFRKTFSDSFNFLKFTNENSYNIHKTLEYIVANDDSDKKFGKF